MEDLKIPRCLETGQRKGSHREIYENVYENLSVNWSISGSTGLGVITRVRVSWTPNPSPSQTPFRIHPLVTIYLL